MLQAKVPFPYLEYAESLRKLEGKVFCQLLTDVLEGAGQQEATCGFLNLHHQVPLCSSALWFWWEIPLSSQLLKWSYAASGSVLVLSWTATSWFVCYSRGRSLPENLVHKYNVGDWKHPSCLLRFHPLFLVLIFCAANSVTNAHVLIARSLGQLEYLKSFEQRNRGFKDGLKNFFKIYHKFTVVKPQAILRSSASVFYISCLTLMLPGRRDL